VLRFQQGTRETVQIKARSSKKETGAESDSKRKKIETATTPSNQNPVTSLIQTTILFSYNGGEFESRRSLPPSMRKR
jgi:hypothetical protein